MIENIIRVTCDGCKAQCSDQSVPLNWVSVMIGHANSTTTNRYELCPTCQSQLPFGMVSPRSTKAKR